MATAPSSQAPGAQRIGRLLLAASIAILVAGSLLVACTTGGIPEAPSGATTAGGGVGTATSGSSTGGPGAGGASAGGAAIGTGGSSGKGSVGGTTGTDGAGGSASAPVTTNTSPMLPAVSYAADPGETALEKVLPGMYGLDSLGAAVKGTSVTIDAAANCALVFEVIEAGQWAVRDLVKPAKGDSTYLGVLTDGSRTAALVLTDTGNSCEGTITPSVTATFTLSGALTDPGPAQLFPMSCAPSDATDPAPVYGIYQTAHATYLLVFTVLPTAGTHTTKGADDTEVLLYRASADRTDLAAGLAALKAVTSTVSEQSDTGVPAGWNTSGTFVAANATTGTAIITSTKPLAGTVSAKNLSHPGASSPTQSLSTSFACAS